MGMHNDDRIHGLWRSTSTASFIKIKAMYIKCLEKHPEGWNKDAVDEFTAAMQKAFPPKNSRGDVSGLIENK